jgi:hypothetical protein
VLDDPDAARAQVEAVRAVAARLTWDRCAQQLLAVYERALAEPPREAAALAWAALRADERREAAEIRLHDMGGAAHALVGEGRLLPPDAQRVLAGLLGRRATRRATLAALRALGRVRGPRG